MIPLCCSLNVKTDLVLRETGVTEIEFTSVITVDIKHVVSTFWRDKEASASSAKILEIKKKYFRQDVGPFGPVSWSAFVKAKNVRQLVRSRVIPCLNLQASSPWVPTDSSGSKVRQRTIGDSSSRLYSQKFLFFKMSVYWTFWEMKKNTSKNVSTNPLIFPIFDLLSCCYIWYLTSDFVQVLYYLNIKSIRYYFSFI